MISCNSQSLTALLQRLLLRLAISSKFYWYCIYNDFLIKPYDMQKSPLKS